MDEITLPDGWLAKEAGRAALQVRLHELTWWMDKSQLERVVAVAEEEAKEKADV